MAYKIHPGIGVARVGDSPTDWFVGPETIDEPEPPYGGYRDAEGRIKRQAGRFRVFEHVGNTATPVAGVNVVWTVVLGPDANGPSATLSGPNKVAKLAEVPYTGTPSHVSWGEIRTDSEGHLLVLSGVVEGPGKTFSATSQGKITAQVSGTDAASSWIILLPPNWVPSRRPSLSVYDYLVESLGVGVPSPLLFMRDVYPILKAVEIEDTNLPMGSAADHAAALSCSVYNAALPGACYNHVTATEHAILTAWTMGQFTNDWTSPPPPRSLGDTKELDRGPLSRVSAGGWDLGSGPATFLDGLAYLNPADPLRLDFAAPNQYPAFSGYSGWRDDNCTTEWPEVWYTTPNHPITYQADQTWRWRGFVVRQGGGPAYVEDNEDSNSILVPYVLLLSRRIEFGGVPQSATSETTAIVFEVGHQNSGVQFDLTLPSWLTGPATYQVPNQANGTISTEHIPITYTPGVVGQDLSGTILVQQQGGPLFSIPVHAATVMPVATEVVFVLDYSSSMWDLTGDGQPKVARLRDALDTFGTLARPADGVGAAAFNHMALGTLPVAPPSTALHDFAANLSPGGSTSIGAGITSGVTVLGAQASSYTQHALIVVTDGMENTSPYINDVVDLITDPTKVFAVGIGRPQDVNTSTLQALSGNRGGYLLLTGSMASGVEDLILEKYFLRILANATNLDVSLDPPGVVHAGRIERIPFFVTEFDESFDAIVLSRERDRIGFALEAPDGTLVTPATLEGVRGSVYSGGPNVLYYRIRLPLPLLSAPAVAAGTWHMVLAVRRPRTSELGEELNRLIHLETRAQVRGPMLKAAVPFEALVHTKSELHLDATLQQISLVPGAPVLLEALLSLHGKPFTGHAKVEAIVEGPTGHKFAVELTSHGSSRYVGRFEPIRPGIYRVSIVCKGTTAQGHTFRREQLATAAVLDGKGGAQGGAGDTGCELCRLLACMLAQNPHAEWAKRLHELGIDVKALEKCCAGSKAHAAAREAERARTS